MTVSGTWSFTVTATDIVQEAMLNCGALGEGEVPTSQEYNDSLRKLNMLVKQLMSGQDFAPGLKMWERQRGDLFLGLTKGQYQLGPSGDNFAVAVTGGGLGQTYNQTQLTANVLSGATVLPVLSSSTVNLNDKIGIVVNSDIFWTTVSGVASGSITIATGLPAAATANAYLWNYTTQGQRPLGIATALLRDITNTDVALRVMTLQDYEALPTKTQPGFQADPTAYYYESQFLSGNSVVGPGQLYLDVAGAQDVTKHLHIVYVRPVMDINNPGDNPEYPQQWYRALCWALTREICGMFDAIWTPDMQANYVEAAAMAREADSENTSYYFQPNAGDPWSG